MPDQQKIAVYSVPDLKNTTDDALPNYLNSLKFRQSHRFTDVRLALGYTAVIIAGALFYFDYKFGWDATKAYTGPAVLAYFALNSAFMYWMYFVEKGMVYSGEKDGMKLEIASRVEKNMPIYHLTVRFASGDKKNAKNNLWQEIHLQAPFTNWFTTDGYFATKPFQQFIASEIPIVGAADPNNVVEEIGRGSGANEMRVDGGNVQDVLSQLKAAGANARRRG
ncbi:microsomal signal peptidase 25 kda subunit [Diplodia corticola]|uniref:Signal peptidase complex subunit 2 n=1 Tax=Diplodia corticola TaxID=236234 RepID=A0A1J9QLD4_9PEZI|nr:microsomal signal peptidase 25 kda subunit [Diplodia corticola]OJD29264.1 microsomal signal peptidase 25 kda subunit [Diplodia corticola]